MKRNSSWYRLLLVVGLGVFLIVGYGFTTAYLPQGVGPAAPVPWEFFGDGFMLRWTPTGAEKTLKPPECQRAELRKLIQKHSGKVTALAQDIQQWLDHCDHAYPSVYYNQVQVLFDFFLMNYDYKEDPRVRVQTFHLKNKAKLQAMVGFQRGPTKRPLILVRCGVACDLSNGPDKATVFMHLMEESGFHVVILTSASSTLYAKENGEMFVSGIEEGAQMLEVLEQIRQSPEWARISEVHLLGVSLGANGALFASQFSLQRPELQIRSAIAMCPVVDMGAQLRAALAEDVRGFFFDSQIRDIFATSQSRVAELSEALPNLRTVPRSQLLEIILEGSYKILKSRPTSSDLLNIPKPKSYEDFLRSLRFQDVKDQPGVPTLVIHAEDDMLVPSSANSEQLGIGGKNLGVIRLRRGNHCAFNQGIEWTTFSEILRSFYLKESKDTAIATVQRSPIGDLLIAEGSVLVPMDPLYQGPLLGARWVMASNPYRLGLELTYKSDKKAKVAGPLCEQTQSSQLPEYCLERVLVPMDSELMRRIGSGLPLEALSAVDDYKQIGYVARWMNTRTQLLNENRPAVGEAGLPTHIEIESIPNF